MERPQHVRVLAIGDAKLQSELEVSTDHAALKGVQWEVVVEVLRDNRDSYAFGSSEKFELENLLQLFSNRHGLSLEKLLYLHLRLRYLYITFLHGRDSAKLDLKDQSSLFTGITLSQTALRGSW